jgi:hypothetical protein
VKEKKETGVRRQNGKGAGFRLQVVGKQAITYSDFLLLNSF